MRSTRVCVHHDTLLKEIRIRKGSMGSTKAAFCSAAHKAERKRLYSRFAGVRVYAFSMKLSLFRGFVTTSYFPSSRMHTTRRNMCRGCNYLSLSLSLLRTYVNHQKVRLVSYRERCILQNCTFHLVMILS